jgi:hypothetical protein
MDSRGNSVKAGSFRIGWMPDHPIRLYAKTRATKALRIDFPYAMVRLVSLDP